jgi:RNA polymerase sigma factor (TIGR02999 family)
MASLSPKEITQLLVAWKSGDQEALDKLMPLIYDELRRLAKHYMRGERAGHTLESVDLVNEAYLRLIDANNINWQNRAHFFGVAAQIMRNILVDHARKRVYAKRGGAGQQRLTLSKANRIANKPDMDLVALDDALKDLASLNSQQTKIVELRFFGGLSIEETAEVLGIGHATVEREWKMARAWLRRELSR